MSLDLLGDEIQMTASRSLLEGSHGFQDFWTAYPKCDRKVGKKQCEQKWRANGCCNNALHIIAYVEYLKTTEQWQRGFIPLPKTLLNASGWLDWEPPIAKPKFTRDPTILALEAHAKKAVPMPAHLRK